MREDIAKQVRRDWILERFCSILTTGSCWGWYVGRMTKDSSLCLFSCMDTEQPLNIDKYLPGQRECHQQEELPMRMLSGVTVTVLHSGSRAGLKHLSRSDCFDE